MSARFQQRLSRLEQRADLQAAAIACTCRAHPLIVFSGDPPPDIEPCPAHGPVRIIGWPLPRSVLDR
jgi:hypothetical protein